MKGPVSHEGYEQRYLYQEFIKKFLSEQSIPLSPWTSVQPLYLRYRARCLKLQPETYEQFLNLCTFESNRKTKYDIKGELKEGEKAGWNKKVEKVGATGSRDVICRLRKDYKLNYKAPPKKEDFELDVDYRLAYKDWSYLKYSLADYEAVKELIEEFENGQHTAAVGDNNQYYYQYPWLIKYALRCLSGVYPIECFPEPLNNYREELQELLNKQKKAYSKSESETILNDLIEYLEETKT